MFIYERCKEERDETQVVEKGGEQYIIQNSHIKFAGQNFWVHNKLDLECSETTYMKIE